MSAVAVAVTASWVAAVFSRFALRVAGHVVRFGGGLGATLYMLVPFLLPLAGAAGGAPDESPGGRRSAQDPSTGVAVSISAFIVWAVTIAAVFAFACCEQE